MMENIFQFFLQKVVQITPLYPTRVEIKVRNKVHSIVYSFCLLVYFVVKSSYLLIPYEEIIVYSESLKSVERKYLEILKVWSLTEKHLTQIIYAREAELRIQDFYFDQVEKLRKTFDQTATLIGIVD